MTRRQHAHSAHCFYGMITLPALRIVTNNASLNYLFCSLASHSTIASESLRDLGAISDLSVAMAKYPIDEGKPRNAIFSKSRD